jgi:hypothetical protein
MPLPATEPEPINVTVRAAKVEDIAEDGLAAGAAAGGTTLKLAVTVSLLETVVVQVPVPEHPPPDHPVKLEPGSGVAVSVSLVPLCISLEQKPGHSTFVPVTTPEPPPASATVNVRTAVNVAVTVAAFCTGTTQVPVPVHGPDQPVKIEPAAGVSLSVNVVVAA